VSFFGPSAVWIHVGGRDLTGDTFTLEESAESAFEEVHPFGSTWEEQLPVGIGKMTLSAGGGLYNEGVILDALQETRETRQLVAWGMSGQTIGKECVIVDGTYAGKWKRVAERNALTKAEAEHTISGVYRRGVILHPMGTPELADGDTIGLAAPKGGVDYADSHLNVKIPIALHNTDDSLFGPVGNPIPIATSNATTESVICAELFGLKTGDYVLIAGHSGSTPSLNGKHQVTVLDAFSFTLDDVANITAGGTGGTFSRATGHGLVTGDVVIISDVSGSTPALNGEHSVTRLDDYHFKTAVNITVAGTGGFFQRVTSHEFYAHLHVSALSGCAKVTVSLMDSPDDDTYTPVGDVPTGGTTLAAFTAAAATAVLTYGAAQATAARRVTIAGVTYTFVVTVAAEYDVKIGADVDATMLNLSRAINMSGGSNALAGDYFVRAINGFVSAVHSAGGNTITLTARKAGANGNNLRITSIAPFDEPTFTLPSLFTGGLNAVTTAKLEVPDAGAVELQRYTAISWVFGTPGTESATFFVGLARR